MATHPRHTEVSKPKFPIKIDRDIKDILKTNGFEWDYDKNKGNSKHHCYINKETGKVIGISQGTQKEHQKKRYLQKIEKEAQQIN